MIPGTPANSSPPRWRRGTLAVPPARIHRDRTKTDARLPARAAMMIGDIAARMDAFANFTVVDIKSPKGARGSLRNLVFSFPSVDGSGQASSAAIARPAERSGMPRAGRRAGLPDHLGREFHRRPRPWSCRAHLFLGTRARGGAVAGAETRGGLIESIEVRSGTTSTGTRAVEPSKTGGQAAARRSADFVETYPGVLPLRDRNGRTR